MEKKRRSANRRGSARPWWLREGLALFALALAVRLLHLWQVADAPFFDRLLGDAGSYDAWAVRIAGGDWLGDSVFYQAPLYPYVLAVIYAVAGRSLVLVRLVQAVLGALACVLLAGATRRLFTTRPAAPLAGVLLALYPTAVFFDARVDKSSLDLFFMCLALGLVGRLVDAPSRRLWWIAGVTFGGLALTRENAFALILAVAAWIVLDRREGRTGAARALPLFALGLATVLLPVGLRNLAVGGELHLTTSQFGPNFYIGNNPRSDGTYQPLRHGQGMWQHERQDAEELAEAALGRELSAGEVSRYWTGQALSHIVSHPLGWLRSKAMTFRLLWNAVEMGDSEDLYSHADRSAVVRLPGLALHFGTIVPLAVLGLWITRGRRARLLPLYLMIAAYAASVVLFYVLGRYRHPLLPLLLMFAAAALTEARDWWRSTPGRRVAPVLGVTALVAVFCNWPAVPRDAMRAVTELNVANAFEADGDTDAAIRHLERALELHPSFDVAHYNLANLLRARGEDARAVEHYRRAVEIRPDYFEAYNNWGVLALERRRLDEAARLFRRVLDIEPGSSQARYNLGNVLRLRGDLDGAIEQYRRVLRDDPTYAPALRALEQVLRQR